MAKLNKDGTPKAKKSFLAIFSKASFPKVKRIFGTYIWPSKGNLFLAMLFMIGFAACEAASVRILEPVFNEVFIDKNRAVLSIIGLQIMALFAFKGAMHYFQVVFMTKVGVTMVREMQNDLFKKLIYQDVSFFSQQNSGDMLIHFTGDLNMIRDAVLNGFTSLIKDSMTVIFMIALMFWKSPEMAAVMFIVFPIGIYPVVYFGKKVRKIFHKQQVSSGNLFTILSQSFQGIRIVKSYQLEPNEIKRVGDSARDIAKLAVKISKTSNISSPLMEFFGGIAIAATLSYGGMRIMQGQLTTGAFMVFLLAIVAAYKPMKNLANLNMRVQMGMAAIDRVFTLMDMDAEIFDAPKAQPLSLKHGNIAFKDVTFEYVPGVPVLHHVNIEAKHGQTVAIVGLAGSGKSTVINLLQRFYDSKEGKILIDGQDIKSVTIDSLRKNIGFVSQDVVLFDGTIASNILMGCPDANEEEMIEAAKRAGAHDFIVKQEHQYNTRVGERGGNLSGGQKQMISIARAMLKNSPILLLDEATSALDSKSENMVQQGLKKLIKGRTTFIIAHRLSTIRDADRIYVMEGGRVLEYGTHQELLLKKGRYFQLYHLQHGEDSAETA